MARLDYFAPGVYVEEIDRGSRPIEGVQTNIGWLYWLYRSDSQWCRNRQTDASHLLESIFRILC